MGVRGHGHIADSVAAGDSARKNWQIMNTDYRRPIDTFAVTISAVIGLHFYWMA
jgi:hypothetical protein